MKKLVDVQEHAKQTLMRELEIIDKQIEKLQARVSFFLDESFYLA